MTPTVSPRPLEGLRVLEFTFGGAAPLAAKLMGDFGADVVKIESHTRVDFPRITPPFAGDIYGVDRSAYFTNRNSSKRSVELDLHEPTDVAVALRLAGVADVVLNNFRAGVMERLGLGYQQVAAVNPAVIYVSMPMISGTGPNAGFRGFGRNVSALSGIHGLTGYSPDEIIGPGTHFPDHAANPGHALVAILAAVISRQSSGEGCFVEIAQVTSTLQLLGPDILKFAATGQQAIAEGNTDPQASPYGVFRCKGDDRWIAISVHTDQQWNALCGAMTRPDLNEDPRFKSAISRREHESEIAAHLADWLLTQGSPHEIAAKLQTVGVPASPVQGADDLLGDEVVLDGGWLIELDHPVMGHVTYNQPPFRFTDRSEPVLTRAPLLGEHTPEVLRDWLGAE